jgi:hypothetical protein
MSFHPEQERHDALIAALNRIAKGIQHMADAQAQALADLNTAITNIGAAITAEIAALTAALAQAGVNDSPAIETAVSNLNALTASLTSSLPAPTPAAAPTAKPAT